MTYREISQEQAEKIYDLIDMKVDVQEIYEMDINDLNGIFFRKIAVLPYQKDFTKWDNFQSWKKQFDLTNWHFFLAMDGSLPVGGAVFCYHSPEIQLLEGRRDLGILWDIRVRSDYKRRGIGQKLFGMVCDLAKSKDLCQIKIECQNVNLPAIHFYLKQGAHLGGFNRYAYRRQTEVADEIQLFFYLDLA